MVSSNVTVADIAAGKFRGRRSSTHDTMAGMKRRTLLQGMGAAMALPLMGDTAAMAGIAGGAVDAVDKDTVYELRIYHTSEDKLGPLLTRFGGDERKIFERHGMHCVAFWTATDDPLKGKTLIYILRHKSRAIADENWKAFRADPEWVKVKAESEKDGRLVEKSESTFMSLTSFSPVL